MKKLLLLAISLLIAGNARGMEQEPCSPCTRFLLDKLNDPTSHGYRIVRSYLLQRQKDDLLSCIFNFCEGTDHNSEEFIARATAIKLNMPPHSQDQLLQQYLLRDEYGKNRLIKEAIEAERKPLLTEIGELDNEIEKAQKTLYKLIEEAYISGTMQEEFDDLISIIAKQGKRMAIAVQSDDQLEDLLKTLMK